MKEVLSSEQWQRLEAIYRGALQLPQSERSAFLTQACAGDEELQGEAESLLAADNETVDDFLQNGVFTLGMEMMADDENRKDQISAEASTKRFETKFASGTVIDNRYEILSGLDAGGMGEVFKAKDLKFPDRPVAIKVLNRESKRHPWKFKKFREDEPNAQSRVQHPNVAMVLDKGVLPSGDPYLVVELVNGQDLAQVITTHKTEDNQLDFHFVAEIMRQICSGVSAIHRANLIHRDLKPKNILLFETSETDDVAIRVKIIDFGIVRDLDRSTVLGQSVGTLHFMSPEQVNGDEVTIASDVYSLGVIAYQMLTNNFPFNAKTHTKLHALQVEGVKVKPGDLCNGLPEAAETSILKALSYHPHDRQKSAREFGTELSRSLTETKPPHSTRRPSSVERMQQMPTPSRFSRRWIVAAVLLLGVLGVGFWGLWSSIKPKRELTYWLTIVRQRDGKTIRATGREAFDTGDEFRLSITPAQAGALYLFNEGVSGKWHVLFPTRENNNGHPELTAQQTISTKENVFTNWSGTEKGTEKIWLVWANQSIPLLDQIVNKSFETGLIMSDEQQGVLRQFTSARGTALPETITDKGQSLLTLKQRGEILVHLLELEHKDWK